MKPTPIPFPSEHFYIQQLAEGVFAAIATVGGSAISNAGIIDLGGRTLVFDAFMTPQAAHDLRLAAVRLTGREPDLVVNTHYHNDHIWGNQSFSPQTVFVSTSQTRELMQTAGADEIDWATEVSPVRFQAAQLELQTESDPVKRRDVELWKGYYGSLLQTLPDLRVRLPGITFDERLELHGSARSVELLEFHNCHTGSDSILVLRDVSIVFTADLLFVGFHPYLEEADPSQLRLAIEHLISIGAATYVPGHGPLGTIEDLHSNIRYIDACQAAARRLISEGDVSEDRIAHEPVPGEFAGWGFRRFYAGNLASLTTNPAVGPAGTLHTSPIPTLL
jgi:glyoxylase-like metal-dependent hydrolase (beta-lactamase superfamily II)